MTTNEVGTSAVETNAVETSAVATAPGRKTLIAGAVVAGVIALTLIGIGVTITDIGFDWSRAGDPDYIGGHLLRAAGALLLGKAGLKLGLVFVAAVVAGVMWLRSRRS